ncbi:MAG TPA: DUF488 domain-containing protein [Gammaproteobacteria bacterium]|nr:DUF488 domain-containing protein [Gammaproteobacteria bacterium]
MPSPVTGLYTIGHSNHAWEEFLSLLQRHRITLVCDARSQPYSRRYPQYRRETLKKNLAGVHIQYRFMGDTLGARTADASCYRDGRVVYTRLAATAAFRNSLTQLSARAREENTALLCAERDPITCHRMILVTRHLRDGDFLIRHILADGTTESNAAAEQRLLQEYGAEDDLFTTAAARIDAAYDWQSQRIAFERKT